MARIYKESRYVLQLLIGKSYGAQYEDVKIFFYTKNPSNQVMAGDEITIKGNIAEVKIGSALFDNLEDGLIKYIVYGTKDGIPFIEERQSNYFLKTPLDFKPSEKPDEDITCNLGEEWIIIGPESSGVVYELNPQDNGYDGYSKVTVEVEVMDCPTTRIWDAQELSSHLLEQDGEYLGKEQYVKGYITEIQSTRPDIGDARYTIDGIFGVYNGLYDTSNGLAVGDWVLVKGITNIYNGQAQFQAGAEIIEQYREPACRDIRKDVVYDWLMSNGQDDADVYSSEFQIKLSNDTVISEFLPGYPDSSYYKQGPLLIRGSYADNNITRIDNLVYNTYENQINEIKYCPVIYFGEMSCNNVQEISIDTFKYMNELRVVAPMVNLGESFTSEMTISFEECESLFRYNVKYYAEVFINSLYDFSQGPNKEGVTTSYLKFYKFCIDDILRNLISARGWTLIED